MLICLKWIDLSISLHSYKQCLSSTHKRKSQQKKERQRNSSMCMYNTYIVYSSMALFFINTCTSSKHWNFARISLHWLFFCFNNRYIYILGLAVVGSNFSLNTTFFTRYIPNQQMCQNTHQTKWSMFRHNKLFENCLITFFRPGSINQSRRSLYKIKHLAFHSI